MEKIYGLIFDVDGVIADTEAVNAQASIRVFEQLFGVAGVKRADFAAGLGRGAAEYVLAAARVHKLELTAEQIEAATAARQETFLDILRIHPLRPFPGVLELIEAAGARHDFRLAIATSSTREKSEAVLRSAEIPYQRMAYITGSEIKNKKPHPELFLRAAAEMALDPAGCVVIEDAPNGIAAAKAAGAQCLAVTNSAAAAELSQADLIVESLTEVNISTVIGLIPAARPD